MTTRLAVIGLVLASLVARASPSWGGTQPLPTKTDAVGAPIVKNGASLVPNAFYLLPLTSIEPKGWLRRQLEIQAHGLSGHLDEFWPDVGPTSGWLGGDGESWERGPYFLDGLVPLAYLLDDPTLIAKASKWVDWTLSHQRPDGSIGPSKNSDWWPRMVMFKVLTQYQEATADPRVLPVMERYFRYHARHLTEQPLREWAIYRWGEEVLSILWLYNRNGDESLLAFARALRGQGFDWKRQFEGFNFPTKTSKEMLGLPPDMSRTTDLSMRAHGVNNAMALKYQPLWSLVSNDRADRQFIYQQLATLDQYHLLPNGMHSGDEHFAGPDPVQGVELCTVVETMFSLENAIAILGDPALADRLERATFNALPGALSGDMWAHQYDQQPNQVACDIRERGWTSNGPESNVFGLEPNFGCCTANLHQGWPKFAASLWMATHDDGLAAVAYAPSAVQSRVKGGVRLQIMEETDYPFRDEIRFTINPASPVEFPLKLRVPAWAAAATITLNGKPVPDVQAGSFHTITRRWKRGDRVVLKLPMRVRTVHYSNGSVTVERGPLIFALKIGEDWHKIEKGMSHPAPAPAADWEVHPTTPWNYGLLIDPARPDQSVVVTEKKIREYPFTPDGAPVEITLKGRRVPQWTLVNGSAGPLPPSPVHSREPDQTLTLIPYGAAKLRITAFPLIAQP